MGGASGDGVGVRGKYEYNVKITEESQDAPHVRWINDTQNFQPASRLELRRHGRIFRDNCSQG